MKPAQPSRSPGINFFIHDLSPFGGQDRSTLEILFELSREMPVHVYACSFSSDRPVPPGLVFHRCPFQVRRPVLLKAALFHLWSLWARRRGGGRLNFATGTCSLTSDVIHVQFLAQAWRKEKSKLLVQRRWHARQYHRALAAYNEMMENFLFNDRRSYVAISESVASDLRSHFGVSRVRVIHHGVDSTKFSPAISKEEKNITRKSLGLPDGPLALFVGAYDRKGLATLALAAREARVDCPDLKVVAVGAGDAAAYRRIAGEGSNDWLILHPPSKNIESYFQAADIFALPTLYEPFGLVILEAMSAGLRVITSCSAGAAELIREGKNGLLLKDPTSVQELAAALREAARDSSATLGCAARATAQARHWSQVAREFQDWIEHPGART